MEKLKKLSDRVGAFLMGRKLPGENVSPENKLVTSYIYGFDDLPRKRVSRRNRLTRSRL